MNSMTPEQTLGKQNNPILLDLKARQQAGEHMPCPRCGKDTMKPDLHTNALSRHADLYLCDKCGTAEALLDFMNNPAAAFLLGSDAGAEAEVGSQNDEQR